MPRVVRTPPPGAPAFGGAQGVRRKPAFGGALVKKRPASALKPAFGGALVKKRPASGSTSALDEDDAIVHKIQAFVNKFGHRPSTRSALGKETKNACERDPAVKSRVDDITRGLFIMFSNKQTLASDFVDAYQRGEDLTDWGNWAAQQRVRGHAREGSHLAIALAAFGPRGKYSTSPASVVPEAGALRPAFGGSAATVDNNDGTISIHYSPYVRVDAAFLY